MVMVKHSPSRNHRSRGIKVKHVLQICVLVAICFWLVYQVKHSHDKKKAFDEHEAKISVRTHLSDEVLKFGRKDLQPRLEDTTMTNDKLDEEEAAEEETGGEEEGNKNEEEEPEEDNKNEEKEEEEKGGDDEIDEGDQEKSQMDDEHEEDFIEQEKEREEGDEKGAEENDSEDNERSQNGNSTSLEDSDRDGGSTNNRNAHEAREENYRGDDASSAVTHETETERVADNSNENTETNIVEGGSDKSINTTGLKVEKGGTGVDGVSQSVTGTGHKGSEIGSFESKGGSHLNSTMATEFNNQPEIPSNLLLRNETETRPETYVSQNATVKYQPGTNFIISNYRGKASGKADAVVESTNTKELAVPEKIETFNTSVEGHSGSLTRDENADTKRNEKSETVDGTDKNWESPESGNTDSSIPLEKKDVRTNGTLPEITTEGTNNGDAAAH